MKKTIFTFCLFFFAALAHLTASTPQNVVTLDLSNPVNPAFFQYVPEKGNWTETYNDEDYSFIDFEHFSFSHLVGGPGSSFGGYYWDGFTVCNSGDTLNYQENGSEGWIANQWGCMAGGGIKTGTDGEILKDSEGKVAVEKGLPYLLAYWGYYMETSGGHSLQTIFNEGKTYKAVGMYVNNHPWPFYGNMNGDGFARKLNQEGDYFKLIIHGMDENLNDNGKSVEYKLAEYTNGTLIQSKDWEWVDLSALGEIGGLYYTMETTDADPVYGPNTSVYFCMDKLQVQKPGNITISMNSTSRNIELKNKVTNEIINVGEMQSGYKYNFTAYPGDYILSAYQSDGTTSNGTIELTITNDTTQSFQFYTITTGASNSGWTLGTDYTVAQSVSGRDGTTRVTTPGSSTTANRVTFLVYSGDTYFVQLVPNETRAEEGYLPYETSGTVTANVSRTGAIPMGYAYNITIPEGAGLFVGKKYAHFRRFSAVEPVSSVTVDQKSIYTFKLAGSQVYNYRVSQPDNITYAGLFTMSSSLADLEVTADMLTGDPAQTDRDLLSNNKYNVADIFININEKGFLKMDDGDTFQLVNIRTWQTVNSITDNYFIEPDYHYTVINENGQPDNSVVTIDESGLITAEGNGTAIVLVTYDAIHVKSATGGPFFGAIWPENTGVFVVSVGTGNTGIDTNMTINEALNTSATTNKVAGDKVDAELDVFYYTEDQGGYDYTFTPAGVTSVSMARSTISDGTLTYNGFSGEGVTENGDGSYTVHLTHGKNIIRLNSENTSEYQVMRAKPVSYTISNLTDPEKAIVPGDNISVRFNTLYHPANKLAGVYNMAAKIVYTANESTVNSTANQYAFASTVAAQTISATIPSDWDPSETFDLTGGVINVTGFGDPYGGHREITLEAGKNPNFTAVVHNAYFGALPAISIQVQDPLTTGKAEAMKTVLQAYPNPFNDYIMVTSDKAQEICLYSISGQCLIQATISEGSNRLDVQSLPRGIYILRCGDEMMKVQKGE